MVYFWSILKGVPISIVKDGIGTIQHFFIVSIVLKVVVEFGPIGVIRVYMAE